MVTRFAASLRTDNSPQRKEARPLSHALTSDKFNIWTPRLTVWSGGGAINGRCFPIHLLPAVEGARVVSGQAAGSHQERGSQQPQRAAAESVQGLDASDVDDDAVEVAGATPAPPTPPSQSGHLVVRHRAVPAMQTVCESSR
jgi:hypothetical protein